MKSSFDPREGKWKLKYPEDISQYDLVYLSPPIDPMQGIPIGNGDVGALIWCEDKEIIIALNKSDLWDDAPFKRFRNWARDEEERSTTLRHAGRIIIDFGVPIFDIFYLNDFEGRLDLARARAEIYSSTPFGRVNFSAYISRKENILVLKCESEFEEKVKNRVLIERWGSRTFSHWYAQIKRDPSIGLKGTDISIEDKKIFLTQELTSGTFTVGSVLIPEEDTKINTERLHSRCGVYKIESEGLKKGWKSFLTVTSPQGKEDSKRIAHNILRNACNKDESLIFSEHQKFWADFWNRSYININDKYLENLWYLYMYYAGSSCLGEYPPNFINALWGWNRDVRPWNFYFHWNQQEIYWPLLAAGHSELMVNYLNYRFNSLPYAIEDAKSLFGVDGAFISDVTDRRGCNSEGEKNNHTPVAQIAMDFWRYYKYTGDKEFLKEKAFPFMIEASKFFESLLEKRSDGFYHAKEGTAYEGWILMEDTVTEISMAKALFQSVLDAAKELDYELGEYGKKLQEILEKLYPIITIKASKDIVSKNSDGKLELKVGAFKGDIVPTDRIIAAGRSIKDGKILFSRFYSEEKEEKVEWDKVIATLTRNETPYSRLKCELKVYDGIFPTAESCPVFPSEVYGLKDKGSEIFDSLVTTLKAFSPEVMGWDPLPIALARLGLAQEVMSILEKWPDRWQLYCNGFGHYGPEDIFKAEAGLFFRTNMVRDVDSPPEKKEDKFPFPSWPFRHMGMESMAVLSTTINEMLLQSHDRTIKIAPAFKGNAEFSLYAVDGFIVSSEIKDGTPKWVAIKSLLGKPCRIENPWKSAELYIFENSILILKDSSKIISFNTKRDSLYIISQVKDILKNWEVEEKIFERNKNARISKYGQTSLGIPRQF